MIKEWHFNILNRARFLKKNIFLDYELFLIDSCNVEKLPFQFGFINRKVTHRISTVISMILIDLAQLAQFCDSLLFSRLS